MIITEKQIAKLVSLAHHTLSIANTMNDEELRDDIGNLLIEIINQQSDEKFEVK